MLIQGYQWHIAVLALQTVFSVSTLTLFCVKTSQSTFHTRDQTNTIDIVKAQEIHASYPQ